MLPRSLLLLLVVAACVAMALGEGSFCPRPAPSPNSPPPAPVPERCQNLCDMAIAGYKPNICTACLSDMTIPQFCLTLFARNGVPAPDGVCDPYHTKQPTKQPTPEPTKKPTEYYFPTASPQSRDEYRQYFEDKRSKAPNSQPGGGNEPGSSVSSVSGLAIGLGVGIGVVAVLFALMCCIKWRRLHSGSNAEGATEFGSGALKTMLPTSSPEKKKPYGASNNREDEVALT